MVSNEKLREAQILQNELLKKFKKICVAEGIQYYLLGGTALGAVRHKGFIPWDDDIDVALFRNDYDRFVEVAKKYLTSDEGIMHYTIDDSYRDYTMKLVNRNVYFSTQQQDKVIKQNIWIDIFPIDGSPNSQILRWIHFRRVDFFRMLLAFKYIDEVRIDEKRALWRKILIWIVKKVPIGNLICPSKAKKSIDKEFRKYPVEKSELIGNYMGAYHEKEFFPKYYFADGVDIEFEGESYTAPKEIDKYLTHQYGDYMRLPPEEKQVPKHFVLEVLYEK